MKEKQPDPLMEILSVMNYDQLLTLRRRLELVKKKDVVSLLTSEIEKRKAKGEAEEVERVEAALLASARAKFAKGC